MLLSIVEFICIVGFRYRLLDTKVLKIDLQRLALYKTLLLAFFPASNIHKALKATWKQLDREVVLRLDTLNMCKLCIRSRFIFKFLTIYVLQSVVIYLTFITAIKAKTKFNPMKMIVRIIIHLN